MPSYKTHSIHGEFVYPLIQSEVKIDMDLLKLFCIGPDALIASDYHTFDWQHAHQSGEFFFTLIDMIQERKLEKNSEVMTFLYGQIDHYVLDVVMHPYIYYLTEKYPNSNILPFHGIFELWMDDYLLINHEITDRNYKKVKFKNKKLKKLINDVYYEVYGVKHAYSKYKKGLRRTLYFDKHLRSPKLSWFYQLFHLGDITYHNSYALFKPFLNKNHKVWKNPETGDEKTESLNELWKLSIIHSRKLIREVNEYLYRDGKLSSSFWNDLSYNTGIPCKKRQKFRYVKKYKGA